MQPEKLVRMANQIAAFCASNPRGARQTADVADHINKFWEPRMRLQLFVLVEAGETTDLHPLVLDAIPHIRRPKAPLEERTRTEAELREG